MPELVDFQHSQQTDCVHERGIWIFPLFDKKNKSVDVYKLDDDSKLLVIFTEDNKISNIKVMNKTSNIIDKIKDEVLDK